MLSSVDIFAWKKAVEGMARGVVGPFTQCNRTEGLNSIREYCDGDIVVARMTTQDQAIPRLSCSSHLCDQQFFLTQEILNATSWIYIPTDEEYEEWTQLENDLGKEVISVEIAKREVRE